MSNVATCRALPPGGSTLSHPQSPSSLNACCWPSELVCEVLGEELMPRAPTGHSGNPCGWRTESARPQLEKLQAPCFLTALSGSTSSSPAYRVSSREPHEPLRRWSLAGCHRKIKVPVRRHLPRDLMAVRQEGDDWVSLWKRPLLRRSALRHEGRSGFVGAEA